MRPVVSEREPDSTLCNVDCDMGSETAAGLNLARFDRPPSGVSPTGVLGRYPPQCGIEYDGSLGGAHDAPSDFLGTSVCLARGDAGRK
jgi:hypothetical protein